MSLPPILGCMCELLVSQQLSDRVLAGSNLLNLLLWSQSIREGFCYTSVGAVSADQRGLSQGWMSLFQSHRCIALIAQLTHEVYYITLVTSTVPYI